MPVLRKIQCGAVYMVCGFLLLLCEPLLAVDTQSVMLQYSLAQLDVSVASAAAVSAVEQPLPARRQLDGDPVIEQLLQLAGKKERKIIERILDVGAETGIIKVEQLKQKLSRINVPALVELYRDVRTLKLEKLDTARIAKIQATLTEIDASLAGKGLNSRQIGDLFFFAGLARDRLASAAGARSEKEHLRRAAVVNYQQTVAQLSEEKDHASREKVADASERIVELQHEFGNLVPLAPASGPGKVVLTSDFGLRVHPVSKKKRFHSGIDLAGWKCNGWKVMTLGSGRVIKSGWEGGYGYTVVGAHNIDGNSLFTRYAHLRKAGRIPIGTIVKTGERVGYCNNTGVSTGSHLHLEVRDNSESGPARNPKPYLPKIELLK